MSFSHRCNTPRDSRAKLVLTAADYLNSESGSQRLDRIERVVELLVNNQLAIQEQHDQDFKKLMTWQVLMQDRFENLTVKVDTMAVKVDQVADKIDGVIERIDKLVIAIGELIRSNRESHGTPRS
jgi:predicted metal-dependent enzyme (double-stranded beta helix superfamily)